MQSKGKNKGIKKRLVIPPDMTIIGLTKWITWQLTPCYWQTRHGIKKINKKYSQFHSRAQLKESNYQGGRGQ